MPDNSSNNSRIAKNTIFLYVRMIFVLLVGLYTSRVVLNVLGVSDYGIYNVVAGFVSLFSFLNATLSSSLQRFYNYESGRSGDEGIVKVYSLGFRIHALLAIVVFIILETFGVWYINNVMVLPEGRLETALYLYQFSIVSMLLVIIKIPYSSVIIAKEKMDFYAVVSILEVLLRLGIVLVLPYIGYDKLLIYGLLQLGVSTIDFILNTVYAKRKFLYLKLQKNVDKPMLKTLLSFSGWNLIGTIIFMLKGQGVNLILNAFFGTIVNAARGVAFQVNSAVMGFSGNIAMSFRPQMVSSYSQGDNHRAYSLFMAQSKLCYCLMLMIITPIIIEINYLLRLWLGNAVPDNTNIFTALVLIDATICTLNSPITQIIYATGNIKNYQIATSSVNIFLIPVCWLFLRMGADAWVVFLITIVVSIINQTIALIAMHKVFAYSYKDYFIKIIKPCLLLTLLVPVVPYALTLVMEDSFVRLIIVSILSVLSTINLLYLFFMTSYEKNLVQVFIEKIFRK